MVTEITNTLLQLLVFTLVPLVVYVVQNKSFKGFFSNVGLKNSTKKANLIALGLSIVPLIPFLVFIENPAFFQMMKSPDTVTGKLSHMGVGAASTAMLVLIALVKTSLTEEILFRGFIAKRLVKATNFRTGNIVQALIFGVLHLLIFLSIEASVLLLAFVFIVPAVFAYTLFYLNEKLANGSIIPGWIAHGVGNLIAYTTVCFLV